METNNTKRLDELLKDAKPEAGFFEEAMKQLQKENAEKKKTEALSLLRQAMDLKSQMQQVERETNKQLQKFDKSLGKVLNAIENMSRGRPVTEETENESDKENQEPLTT